MKQFGAILVLIERIYFPQENAQEGCLNNLHHSRKWGGATIGQILGIWQLWFNKNTNWYAYMSGVFLISFISIPKKQNLEIWSPKKPLTGKQKIIIIIFIQLQQKKLRPCTCIYHPIQFRFLIPKLSYAFFKFQF